MQEAPRVEERRGDHNRLAVAPRDLREQRRQGAEALWLAALSALRRPGGPRGQDDVAAALLGSLEVLIRRRVRDQLLDGRLVGLVDLVLPGYVLAHLAGDVREQVGELL